MRRIRQVILDWSGTLVDDLAPVVAATNQIFAKYGLPLLTVEDFRREFYLPAKKFYAARLPKIPFPELAQLFVQHYHQVCDTSTVLPHVPGFLEYCREARLGVFIASAIDPGTYERHASRFGIAEFVTRAYVGIADKTRTIHTILAENQLEPAATMVVGDMVHDIAAGQAGGIATCAVLTGYTHSDKLTAAQPDLICAHLGELQERLTHG